METWETFKKELLKDEKVAREYKKLEPRYALIAQIIEKRIKKGLTQAQLAKRIGTHQSAVARIESGEANPSVLFLEKVAGALESKLEIKLH